MQLNTVTYKEYFFKNHTTTSQPFLISCYFTKIFVHLSVIAAVETLDPANMWWFQVSSRNTRKSYEICSKLIIKTAENHSGVFIDNFEHFSSDSAFDFK